MKAMALVAALALMAGTAHASLIDLKVTGTVGGSSDVTGVFGTPGATLNGDAFIADYLFDTSKGTRTNLSPNYDILQFVPGQGLSNPLLKAELTINGHSYHFNGLDQNSISVEKPDGVFGAASFDTPSRTQTRNVSFIDTYGMSGSVPGSLDGSFSGDAMNFAAFSLDNYQIAYDDNGQSVYSFGSFNVEHVSSLVSGAPEPGVWALMIAGIGLMGAALRLGLCCDRLAIA